MLRSGVEKAVWQGMPAMDDYCVMLRFAYCSTFVQHLLKMLLYVERAARSTMFEAHITTEACIVTARVRMYALCLPSPGDRFLSSLALISLFYTDSVRNDPKRFAKLNHLIKMNEEIKVSKYYIFRTINGNGHLLHPLSLLTW